MHDAFNDATFKSVASRCAKVCADQLFAVRQTQYLVATATSAASDARRPEDAADWALHMIDIRSLAA